MADAAQKRLDPDAAAQLLDAIRAKNASTVRWALINFDADRERFLNTPFSENGGERTLFLMEALKTGDAKIVTILLEGGAKPETRVDGASGKNAFCSDSLNVNCAGLMLSAMRNRLSSKEVGPAIHEAIVGGPGQKTDSCLFRHLEKKRDDLMFYLLEQLPNGSSRHQALEQFVSPVGYEVDAKMKAEGIYLSPARTINLVQMAELSDRGRWSPTFEKLYTMLEGSYYDRDAPYYDAPRPEGERTVQQWQREAMEKNSKTAVSGLTADQMRDWLAVEEPATLPPPLAKRFLDTLPGLSTSGGGLKAMFAPAAGTALKQLKDTLESFGNDTKEIVNTPILKADGTRTMLLTEIINTGNADAIGLVLNAGADPSKRANGLSGPNAFYAEKLTAAQVTTLVAAVRARHSDTKAADKAVHDAILGAKGQMGPSAVVIQVDNRNGAAAQTLYKALPNETSRLHAWDSGFSPLGLKIDREANAAGIYLSIDRCFNLSDITGFRYEKLGQTIDQATYQLFDGQGWGYGKPPAGNRDDSEFYYPAMKTNDRYMVNLSTRQEEEKRYNELRAKEIGQQKQYRDSLKGALAEREEAEEALKRAQKAFQEQERRLKAIAGEVDQLQAQVLANDTVLEKLAEERGKLRKRLKTLEQSI